MFFCFVGCFLQGNLHALKLTSKALEMVVSNRNLLFQGSIFKGYFSVREGTSSRRLKLHSLNVNDLKI